METITTWLVGGGGLWVILNLVLGLVELATLGTIRPPKKQTFSYIRLAATQYQTVIAPAIGALFSGLLVSIAASFFYESFTEQGDSWKQLAGLGTFIVGAVTLTVTLWSAIKNVGEPVELARDPFSIRSAADESAAAPRRGGLEPDVLTKQLDEWYEDISARSMNLSGKGSSDRLAKYLAQAAQTDTFLLAVIRSFKIYWAALLRFPFRFAWPLLGFLLFLAGIVRFTIDPTNLAFATSWKPWLAVILVGIIAAMATLFYCVTRGNRARLWHRINLVALKDARDAIIEAEKAYASVAVEDELLKRVLSNADNFFQQEHAAPAKPRRTVLRLGRFRIIKD